MLFLSMRSCQLNAVSCAVGGGVGEGWWRSGGGVGEGWWTGGGEVGEGWGVEERREKGSGFIGAHTDNLIHS